MLSVWACLLVVFQVKCWGNNFDGRLGLGSTTNIGISPGQMGDSLPFVDLGAANANGSLPVIQLTAGTHHICALFGNRRIKCWGTDEHGGLGMGLSWTTIGKKASEMGDNLPFLDLGADVEYVSAGYLHTCVVLHGGVPKCWGYNAGTALGTGGYSSVHVASSALATIQVGTNRSVVQLQALLTACTCARLDNGLVKCWGVGYNKILGTPGDSRRHWGSDVALHMGDNLPYINITCGETVHVAGATTAACAQCVNGEVHCWGTNRYGVVGWEEAVADSPGWLATRPVKLPAAPQSLPMPPSPSPGEGTSLPASTPTPSASLSPSYYGASSNTNSSQVRLAVGSGFACTILGSVPGPVLCWGRNHYGQLGQGHANESGKTPGSVSNAPYVNLGPGNTARQVGVACMHMQRAHY